MTIMCNNQALVLGILLHLLTGLGVGGVPVVDLLLGALDSFLGSDGFNLGLRDTSRRKNARGRSRT